MSWYVETLILNSSFIKGRIFELQGISVYIDLDNNDYNDLLIVEKEILDLFSKGKITEGEIEIIKDLSNGRTLTFIQEKMGMERKEIVNTFISSCDKIAYHIGGYFTDIGYMRELQYKLNLSDKEIEDIRKFYEKSYRTRIRRLLNDQITT